MNDQQDIRDGRLVDRAARAIRRTPVPEGPPDEAVRAVLAAGGAVAGPASGRKTRNLRERMFTMNRIAKIAAAIVVVAGIAALGWVTLGGGGATVAWADVQEKIRNARTLTFKMAMKMEGFPDTETKMMFMGPGRMRQEWTMGPSKVVGIFDVRQGKMITLVEKEKKAIVVNLSELPEESRKQYEQQDFLAQMKKLIEESETELGEREIGGRQAKGYQVQKDGQAMTVWADAKTGRPLEMSMTMFQGETKMTMSDFEFDAKLDESLFSLEVPEGYTVVEKDIELKQPSAEDLVELFRIWTKARGGTFPDAVTPGHLMKDGKDIDKGESGEKVIDKGDVPNVTITMTRALVLVAQHPEARYAGKGVKLGDADTPVFWYQPKDSDTYKVIYADLSVRDVAEEDLPKDVEKAEAPK